MRKVINVDARNHGESPHTKEMSLPLMTKDIFHLMRQCNFKDQLSNGRKFSFMGHHMGGRIGMLLALTEPYKVRNLDLNQSFIDGKILSWKCCDLFIHN